MACWVYSPYHPRKKAAAEPEAVQCPVKAPPEPPIKPKRTRRTKAEILADQS